MSQWLYILQSVNNQVNLLLKPQALPKDLTDILLSTCRFFYIHNKDTLWNLKRSQTEKANALINLKK